MRHLATVACAAVLLTACSSGSPSPGGPESFTEEGLARDFGPAVEEFRSEFQDYLTDYSEYFNSTPAGNSVKAMLRNMEATEQRLDAKLDGLAELHRELVPLMAAVIELGAVPEIESGQVPAQDLRRYVELIGLWIESARHSFDLSAECYAMGQAQATQTCMLDLYSGPAFLEGEQITEELNALQLKLFGGA